MPTLLEMAASRRLRPFEPGESILNDDGSRSSEISVTVQLPDGSWANVPSLWMSQNGPVKLDPADEDTILSTATIYEQHSGKKFPRFKTVDEAVAEAERRTRRGGAAAGPLAR